MTAKILDGQALAKSIRSELQSKVATAMEAGKPKPGLSVVLIGDDPASALYVKNKAKACEFVGIHSQIIQLESDLKQERLIEIITDLNHDDSVHGILVQLPLPAHIDVASILDHIDPRKDVDGFHPQNLGCLAQRRPVMRSCTPFGIMRLLESTEVELRGKHAVIVGASNIVGRPMALELLNASVTVTVTHRSTIDLASHIKQADILVVAAGSAGLIPGEWLKPGVIVIDVGINHVDDKVVGDVNFNDALEVASYVTPVPGGVGPMTITCLLENTLNAWQRLTA